MTAVEVDSVIMVSVTTFSFSNHRVDGTVDNSPTCQRARKIRYLLCSAPCAACSIKDATSCGCARSARCDAEIVVFCDPIFFAIDCCSARGITRSLAVSSVQEGLLFHAASLTTADRAFGADVGPCVEKRTAFSTG